MKFDLGIDLRMWHHSGIGTYLKGILPGLAERAAAAGLRLGAFQPKARAAEIPQTSVPWRNFPQPIYSVSEQIAYPFHLADCRLWHSPHYNLPLSRGKTRLVVTIHDIIHWLFRQKFLTPIQARYADFMLRRAVRSADHILAVSENTKQDLVLHLGADPERITVTYEAVSSRFRPPADPERWAALKTRLKIQEPYFLYVGLMKPHKNVAWLIREFRQAVEDRLIQASLVLVGQIGRGYRELRDELSRKIPSDPVRVLDPVGTEDLQGLYQHARALLHPSLYEGFGLTLLEAMACGTPVVACRTSSIPEVTGDAALFFEPFSAYQLRRALLEIQSSEAVRADLIQRGRANVLRFDWEKTAEATFRVYRQVLEGG